MIRAHDPAQASAIAGEDFSAFITEPLHVCLIEGESLGIFAWRGPGIYEIHLALSVRGRPALDMFGEMLATMRREHGARFFWAAVPIESRNVRMFARLAGFKSDGIVETAAGQREIFVSERDLCHSL